MMVVVVMLLAVPMIVIAAIPAVELFLEVGLSGGDLFFGRGSHRGDLHVEAHLLPGQWMVGVDQERIGKHFDDAHRQDVAVGTLRDELVADSHVAVVREIGLVDLEDALVVARAERVVGLDGDLASIARVAAEQSALETGHDLGISMNVSERLFRCRAVDRLAGLIEEQVRDGDEGIRTDSEKRHEPEALATAIAAFQAYAAGTDNEEVL